jgi:hypothetical protein
MTLLILWITDRTVGLRVTADEEVQGLDMGDHGEVAYQWPWSPADHVQSDPEPHVLSPHP